eukprot:TRINITY_DN3616_c0_g3_i1.p1 TRINITY_DN3616_c0_g3~~TRINITY_DN3616_c0_g3_i1.p1  ORF type:complete len:224 (-),score=47.93 TRINITY_DN3616_c0_g3_i1:232-903(-)
MPTSFQELLDDHAIAAFDRQLHLADLIGDRPWDADIDAGTISFGNDLVYHADVLGTQSDVSQTFIWAWDHPIRPPHKELAERVRAAGERLGVAELVQRQVEVTNRVNGHTLAMVAVGLADANAYYRCPYDQGAAFLLIRDDKFPKPVPQHPLLHATSVISQAIMQVDLNHRRAIKAYALTAGLEVEEDGPDSLALRHGHEQAVATFDNRGRLMSSQATVTGPV